MARKGENIYKRKDGRWEGRYIRSRDPARGGTRYGFVYGATYQEVRQKKSAAEQSAASPKKSAFTVRDGFRRWLELREADPQARLSTLNRYRQLIEGHILPVLGDIRVQQLTVQDLENFQLQKLRSGRLDGKGGLSPSVVRTLLYLLSALQSACVDWGYLTGVVSVKRLRGRSDAAEIRVFSLEEQQTLEAALLRASPFSADASPYLGILFDLYTGLRVGELCGLEWQDVDWQAREIRVRRTVQRTAAPPDSASKTVLCVGPPKSRDSIRALPLADHLYQRLLAYYEHLPGEDKRAGSPVFTSRGRRLEPRRFQCVFHALLSSAGLEQGNFHALRHTFATRCIESGMDVRTLSELLGHSGPSITMDRYTHSFARQRHTCIQNLPFHAPL